MIGRVLLLVVAIFSFTGPSYATGFFVTDANGFRTNLRIDGGMLDGTDVFASAFGPSATFMNVFPRNEPPGQTVSINTQFSPDGGVFGVADRLFPIDAAHPNSMQFTVSGSAGLPATFRSGEFTVTGRSFLDAILTTCNIDIPCSSLTAKTVGEGTWKLFGESETQFYTVRDYRLDLPAAVAFGGDFNPGDPRFNSWIGPVFDEQGRGHVVHYVPGQGYPDLKNFPSSGLPSGQLPPSAVPEPSSVIFLASGLFVIAYLKRRLGHHRP